MSGKNLTFKLILDADNKGLVSTAKNSESVMKAVFDSIKSESDKLKQASESASKEIGNIIPDNLEGKTNEASQAVQNLTDSANALADQSSNTGDEVSTLGEQLEAAESGASKANNGLGGVSSELENAANQAQDTQSALGGMSDGLDSTADNANVAADRLSDLAEGATDLGEASNTTSNAVGEIIPAGSIELAGNLSKTLGDATDIIREAGDNAKSTADNFNDFGKVAEKALERLKQDLEEAKQRLEDFSNTNASPEDIETAQQQVDRLAQEVLDADTAFNEFQQEVGRANENLADTGVTAGLAQKGIDGAKFAVNALVGAMATLGVGLGINELVRAADSYTNLSARINIATKDGGDFTSAMAGVHQVALMTNSSLEATGDLFTRLNAVGKEMGMTQQNSLDLTKTINQAIQTSGGSAEASEAAVQQFIQAMQGGVLRGEEFNSIMEGGYGVAEALAKGLGVTTGELRKMAENGELGAERVYKALLSQKDAVQQTFDQFPTTIGNAIQRITTSWEILIGKMDQSNGASATVADWLVTIADNINVVETLLEDIGEGFVWVGDQLKKIDAATIEALKTALVSAYDSIKSIVSTLGNGFEIAGDQINSVLGAVFKFNSGVDTAADKTNGFTKLLQILNVAFGVISDGFSGIAIAANLLSGAVYAVAGGFVYLKSKFLLGPYKDAAIKEFQELTKKSDEYYQKASDAAMAFKSKSVEAAKEIGKTQAEKNQERITDNQQTLDQLKTQEEKHKADYKAISDERIKLEQQLFDARKSSNDAAIQLAVDNLAKLDAKEKEYQAESKKIADSKIKAAQDIANAQIAAATSGGAALSEQIKKTIEAQVAAQGLAVEFDKAGKAIVVAMEKASTATSLSNQKLIDDTRKAASKLGFDLEAYSDKISSKFSETSSTIDNLSKGLEASGITGQKAGDLVFQSWQKWLTEAKNTADIDAAKNKLEAFGKQGVISTAQVEQGIAAINSRAIDIDPVFASAAESAKALGIDLRVAVGGLSPEFVQLQGSLDDTVGKLEFLGITGKQATDIVYEGWKNWLETAKSQAEIDVAKAKLQEFGNQGQISTSQVEQGLIAIKLQAQELPDEIDPVTEAFKRLGIETKENLKLAAQQALMDYITIRDSGKATAEGVQKAYEKAAQAAAVSGDAGVISATNAANAGRNLEIQIDDTGKASVKAMDEWTKSNDRVRDSAHGIGDGYRNAGSIAREEAKSTEQAWSDAVDAASAQFDAEMKRQGQSLSKGIYNYNSYSKADVVSQLKSKGYDDKEAEKLAGTIWSKAMEADRDAKAEGMGKGGNPALNRLIEQEFNNAASKGLTTQHGTNKINDLLRQMSSNNLVSTGSTSKAPAVDVNSLAPQVSTPVPSTPENVTTKNSRIELVSGNKTATLTGSQQDVDTMEEIMREFEMLKRSS